MKARIIDVEALTAWEVAVLEISPSTRALIEQIAREIMPLGAVWAETAVKMPNGNYAVPISDDTALALELIRPKGMSDDALVRRLVEFPMTFRMQ